MKKFSLIIFLLLVNIFSAQQFHFDHVITYTVQNAKTKSISRTSYFINSKIKDYYLVYWKSDYSTSANVFDLRKNLRYRFILNDKENRYDYDLSASLMKSLENSKYNISASKRENGYTINLTKAKNDKTVTTYNLVTEPSFFPANWLFRRVAICCTKEIPGFDESENSIVKEATSYSKGESCIWRLDSVKKADINLTLPNEIFNKLKVVN